MKFFGFVFLLTLFSISPTGCLKRPQIDKKVALELIGVIGYGNRPSLRVQELQDMNVLGENYFSVVRASIPPRGSLTDVYGALASRYAAWGFESDAKQLLAKDKSVEKIVADLNVQLAIITKSAGEKVFDENTTIPLKRVCIEQALVGSYQCIADEIISVAPDSNLSRVRSLNYMAAVLRAMAREKSISEKEGRVARALFERGMELYQGGESWLSSVERLRGKNENYMETMSSEDIIWIFVSWAEIGKRLGQVKEFNAVNNMIQEIYEAKKVNGDRNTAWIAFVRDEYFSTKRP